MRMQQSSIYVRCPGCSDTTLVVHRGPTYVSAGCGFDYGALAKDEPAFERYLVERMREGPMGQLGAIALHQWVSGMGAAASVDAIRSMAARNGIELPDPAKGDPILRGALIFVVLLVVLIAGSIAYVVLTGGS